MVGSSTASYRSLAVASPGPWLLGLSPHISIEFRLHIKLKYLRPMRPVDQLEVDSLQTTMNPDDKLLIKASLISACIRDKVREREVVTVPSLRNHTAVSELLIEEELDLCTQRDHQQGWLPIRIVKLKMHREQKLPCIIFLHPTGSNMDSLRTKQEDYAHRGYLTVATDARYHGARAQGRAEGQTPRDYYEESLVRAWREGGESPFLLDTTYDMLCLLDYLRTRKDIDERRIGVTGFSLGGMHSWLAAVADERIAAVAACSGVQGFRWALDNRRFKERVESIPLVFQTAARDLGKTLIDAEVVGKVWDKIVPGLRTTYDAPLSLPSISPRPLLVSTGELDDRCPLQGVMEACERARVVYEADGATERFEFVVEKGVGHKETIECNTRVRDFFDRHFSPLV